MLKILTAALILTAVPAFALAQNTSTNSTTTSTHSTSAGSMSRSTSGRHMSSMKSKSKVSKSTIRNARHPLGAANTTVNSTKPVLNTH